MLLIALAAWEEKPNFSMKKTLKEKEKGHMCYWEVMYKIDSHGTLMDEAPSHTHVPRPMKGKMAT